MKKILVALLIISCALTSCSKENPIEPIKEQKKNRVFLQVEAVYNDGGSDFSPVVSINL
jgi:hypothetical protein